MNIKSKVVIGLPVISIQEGKRIGKVEDIIYDPSEQRIKALQVGKIGWFSDSKILLIDDVRSMGQDAVLIESESHLRKIVDVPTQIARIAQNNHYLTRTNIITEKGIEEGNVTDIYFDTTTGYVESFEVAKRGLKGLQTKQVAVEDIITVGEDVTIIRDHAEISLEEQAKEAYLRSQSGQYQTGYLGGKSNHDSDTQEYSALKNLADEGGENMRYYTVLGIFHDRADVEQAIMHLKENGFRSKDISLVMRDTAESQDIASSTGTNVAGGAVTGATTGAVIGGIAGLLVGIGAIAIPGVGGLLIGGPLAAALGLTGAAATTATGAVTGAVAGGLLGAIMGLGIPENEARVYETEVKAGGILLAVPALEDRAEDARDILDEFGASDVKSVLLPQEHMYEMDDEEDMDNDYHRHYTDEQPSHFAGAKGGSSRRHTHRHGR